MTDDTMSVPNYTRDRYSFAAKVIGCEITDNDPLIHSLLIAWAIDTSTSLQDALLTVIRAQAEEKKDLQGRLTKAMMEAGFNAPHQLLQKESEDQD